MYQFSENIQKGILYLLKSDKDFFVEVKQIVKSTYFENPIHEVIVRLVNSHFEKYLNLPNDDILLDEYKKNKISDLDPSEVLQELVAINKLDVTSCENKTYILDSVESFARKEAIKEAIKKSLYHIKNDNIDAIEVEIREALKVSRTVDLGQNYFSSVGTRWNRTLKNVTSEKFKTLLPTCNKEMEGGLSRKEMAIVIAPPGVGKSLWLANQAVISMTEGKKVLYITLEMSEDKVATRIDSIISGLPIKTLREPTNQFSLYERLNKFKALYPGSELVIKEFPTGQVNVNYLRALLQQLRNRDNITPDVLIVDYLELLRPCRSLDVEHLAQQRIAEELRGLGMEYKMLVWSATQTNRLGRKATIITDAELADSYGKIRVVDWAISLNQTQREYDEGTMRGYIMKARDSKQNYIIPMEIDYSTLLMKEMTSAKTSQEEEID